MSTLDQRHTPKRYAPNPRLPRKAAQDRMIESCDGEYARFEDCKAAIDFSESRSANEIKARDKLIAKQQLEIEGMRGRIADIKKAATSIIMQIICIGGPLNDNVKGYSASQMQDWRHVQDLAEEIESLTGESHERD